MIINDDLARLISLDADLKELPDPAQVEETIHTAFRSCIDALRALTIYRVAAEAHGFCELADELHTRHAFLRKAIAEFTLWQRELRTVNL